MVPQYPGLMFTKQNPSYICLLFPQASGGHISMLVCVSTSLFINCVLCVILQSTHHSLSDHYNGISWTCQQKNNNRDLLIFIQLRLPLASSSNLINQSILVHVCYVSITSFSHFRSAVALLPTQAVWSAGEDHTSTHHTLPAVSGQACLRDTG